MPKRHVLAAIRPARVLIAAAGIAAIAAGWFVPTLLSAVPIGAGALVLLAAALPAVRDVELGLPGDIRLSAALAGRQTDIASVFEQQRGDLQLCAQLLCGDPEQAKALLEAAWARTAEVWRGPVTPQLRLYTLCVLVHLLDRQDRWGPARKPKHPKTLLAALPAGERIVVVLHDFASLTIAEIAGLTESTTTAVTERLERANERAQLALGSGQP
ncbi:sigma factor-like helix-turn-helix DNA-binding protein [Sinomonas mesophila]|uniref:sigma factor-like helix-turn-helix DNA-binding protein n=1 Tax=Sinomonas mesophila TaxID=1531955 RepID=UPI00158A2DD8|nr:sigma-70 region 4 domain-containing protein [Sinomonas mesophila]